MIVTVLPETVQTDGVAVEKLTAELEVDVALSENVAEGE
jgi:hypothetical protein